MTNLANYTITVTNRDELSLHINNHDKFVSIMQDDLNWLNEIGFIECPMYAEDAQYRRHYYKIVDTEILKLTLQTQSLDEGKFDIRRKVRIENKEEVIQRLNDPEQFKNSFYGSDMHEYIIPSDDIQFPSMISYLTIRIEDFYYDENRKYKRIIKYINIDKLEFIKDSFSDFFLSHVIFMGDRIQTLKVNTDGVERDGYLLDELIEISPNIDNFFHYDKQFDSNMKMLFSALVI